MTRSKLKYLYRVVYTNGEIYDQNLQDISVSCSNKSCYHDLRVPDIKYFILSNGVNSYTLSLLDGSITMNEGQQIYLSSDKLQNFKLKFCRRVTHQITGGHTHTTLQYILGYTAETEAKVTVEHYIAIR